MSSAPSALDSLKERACAKVDSDRAALVELSERIHAHPELRFAEHRAAGWLAEFLASSGYDVERSAFGLETAVAARLGEGRPRVAILCEYDALPGIGHACGHNVIAAAGAARRARWPDSSSGGAASSFSALRPRRAAAARSDARNGAFGSSMRDDDPSAGMTGGDDRARRQQLEVEYRGRRPPALAESRHQRARRMVTRTSRSRRCDTHPATTHSRHHQRRRRAENRARASGRVFYYAPPREELAD